MAAWRMSSSELNWNPKDGVPYRVKFTNKTGAARSRVLSLGMLIVITYQTILWELQSGIVKRTKNILGTVN